MYATMSVMMLVNGREKHIYSERLEGNTFEELRKNAQEIMSVFGDKNPHIDVSSVKIKTTSWL